MKFITPDRMTPAQRLERLMVWFGEAPARGRTREDRAAERRRSRRLLRPRKNTKLALLERAP